MLILPAAPTAQVSGKQDDSIVFFTWRGQQSARSYRVPANPKTADQTTVRSNLATLSSEWTGLTDAQRDGWVAYAALHPTTDRLGRPIQPTGINWFIKANSQRKLMGLTTVATAPTAPPPAPVTTDDLVVSTADNSINITVVANTTAGLALKGQYEICPSVAYTPSINRSRLILGPSALSYVTLTDTGVNQAVPWILPTPFVDGLLFGAWFSTVRVADGTESIPQFWSTLSIA